MRMKDSFRIILSCSTQQPWKVFPLTCCSGLSVQQLHPGRLIRLQTSHDKDHNVSLQQRRPSGLCADQTADRRARTVTGTKRQGSSAYRKLCKRLLILKAGCRYSQHLHRCLGPALAGSGRKSARLICKDDLQVERLK